MYIVIITSNAGGLYSRGPAPQSSHPSNTIILERELTKSDYSGSQNLLNNIFLRVTRDLYVDINIIV